MSQQLAQWDPSTANVLVPTQDIQQVSPWHAARTSIVSVSADPDSGDVFNVGSRWNAQTRQSIPLYCLAKPALMRIAAAAGIVWNWRESGAVSISRDYVCYKAVGAIRLPDGSWQPILANKEIDLEVIEDELREQYAKKADGGVSAADARVYKGEWRKVQDRNVYYLAEDEKSRYIETNVRANMIQWRKNKLMRAETGAMLRVIRAALGIKSQYTQAELQKPFIVPRIDFSPDYNDPAVRSALIEHGVQAMASLFGQSAPAAALGPASAPMAAPFEALPAAQTPEVIDASHIDLDSSYEGPDGEPGEPDDAEDDAPPESGTLFGDQAPGPDAPPEPPPARAPHVATCADCGKGVTEKVLTYSQNKFGRPLCYGCQKGAAANA